MSDQTTTVTPEAPPAAEPPAPRKPPGIPLWANPRLGLVVLLIGLVVLFSTLRPAFLNTALTLVPLQADISVYAVVGLAQLMVLSLGHMNMAVGRMAAMSAFAMGLAYDRLDVPLPVGLVIGLAVGTLLGALAGLIISRTGVNSFVVTLALDFAMIGLITILYTRFTDGVAFSGQPTSMTALRNDTFADYCIGNVCGPNVPLVVPFALVAALAVGLLFRYARLGREILMTGDNARAAELSGIPTGTRVVQAHALSGLLAGLAGFLLAANNGAFSASIGEQFLLPSFLGPVLGGTLLAGGAVSILGTVLGATLTQVIYKGLNLLQFQLDQLKLYIGLVLLVALSLDRVRHVLAERRGAQA
ncbi:monosaccharide ABC transporter membrane protein (CUT2 family) [Micromonospora pisi]|uniref:Autoinducer 2 import system permease protein LsrD n=1 Tax=Micromonospora pisi TaxID=589240 RepID=A0A495JRR4_9ACTN|nr:ABC transporter permease [Micromonospora pisi]RKR91198.1 monosaccharide ABC transporter membrane protein (CUT2 family) [Micromonospora pisi]